MTYRKFREILSSQMLLYNTVHKLYPGDQNMRAWTKVVKTQKSGTVGRVTEKVFAVAKKNWHI